MLVHDWWRLINDLDRNKWNEQISFQAIYHLWFKLVSKQPPLFLVALVYVE